MDALRNARPLTLPSDGEVLPPGTWVVIYHPIIVGRQRNGDGQPADDRAA
ncbi:MAG: hypothetical protein QOJ23_5593 [Actinomycetota bacterium]|jgi:hypothetical protein|nr:hypothetical protein [Actinomycetota bacterium]MDQ1500414.1 hypothetical protein [Actinomycetota bacterium]